MGIRDMLGGRRRGRGPYEPKEENEKKDRARESTRRLDVQRNSPAGPTHRFAPPPAAETVKSARRSQPIEARGPDPATTSLPTPSANPPAKPAPTVAPPRPAPVGLVQTEAEFYVGDTAELPAAEPGRVVAVLIGISGELADVLLPIVEGENRIGRNPDSDIRLPGRTISRSFASLVHAHGAFTLRRLGDKNPPERNGEPIGDEAVSVVDGDRLTFGESTFSFRTTLASTDPEAD